MSKPTYADLLKGYNRFGITPSVFAPMVSGKNPDGTPFRLNVGENALVGDFQIAVPNSAAAASTYDVDVPLPDPLDPEARYAVMIRNNGAVAVTVTLRNRETLFATQAFFQAAQYAAIAAGAVTTQIVQGWLLGDAAAQLRGSPDAVVGATGAFNIDVRVRRL